MSDEEIYYEMFENVHVMLGKEKFNFWRSEIYTEEEFIESALQLEELLKQEKCKLFVKPETVQPIEEQKSQYDLLKRESVEEILKNTGKIAMADARKHNTYIVYQKDGKMVKEYPDGKIVEITGIIDEEEH